MSLMSIWLEVRRSLIQSWFFSLTGHWTLAGLLYISGYHFPLIKERKNQNRWFCKVFASRAGVTQPPVRHTLEHFINTLNMPGPSSLLFCQDQNRLIGPEQVRLLCWHRSKTTPGDSNEHPALKTMSYFTNLCQWGYRLRWSHLLKITQLSSGKTRTWTLVVSL